MIRAVRANRSSFRTVTFLGRGLNVILADRTKESTRKDSRNGLGKSTLLEIIHFCLGSSMPSGRGLRIPALRGWIFALDLDLGGRVLTVYRGLDDPRQIELEGDLDGWTEGRMEHGRLVMNEQEWTSRLGTEIFGLPPRGTAGQWSPTFRSLLPYFARRGRDAFSVPFEHHRKQLEWEKQVANAYLLGLAWEDAQAWQRLREQGKTLDNLKKAASGGLMTGFVGTGTRGELEAELVRIDAEIRRQESALADFQVHPEYRQIECRANGLTAQIQDLNNRNFADRRLIDLYRESMAETAAEDPTGVMRLYEEAGAALPGMVTRHLEEVSAFHSRVVENRRTFLRREIERIETAITTRDQELARLDEERAALLAILRSHGALDEYTRLQQRLVETRARAKDLRNRLDNLKRFETGKSSLKIERERLLQRAQQDHEERSVIRERAISLFNDHSEALYQSPGRLIIEIRDKGFHFDVEIERSDSQGIGSMKIFCYDLMLIQLRPRPPSGPGSLIHDSTLYDGVDERQVALALSRAAQVSEADGFQYITCLNSDAVPWDEFPSEFDLNAHLRLRLTDQSPEGSLLGIRY